ncbi:hypothetical protein T01_709 [Trichinella spiralis]|uniref:Uncharacterized protein n=1 Tax=Trichinella spiralis TaxID=6334 RepID=A0A0V1B0U7_TRISP|nr:hypothetical protein T01_709 [Trichinella spiralis]
MPWIQNYPKPQAIPPYMPFQVYDLCSACKTELKWPTMANCRRRPTTNNCCASLDNEDEEEEQSYRKPTGT